MPRSPLPPREGISATALRAPGGRATHAKNHLPVPDSIGDWLETEFPEAAPESRQALLTDGDMCDEAGRPVTWDDPVIPGGFYFFHRPVPAEERIPFDVGIVFEDEDLIVVDKPHFLASTPNGRFVRECVVTRLRVELDQPDLRGPIEVEHRQGGRDLASVTDEELGEDVASEDEDPDPAGADPADADPADADQESADVIDLTG